MLVVMMFACRQTEAPDETKPMIAKAADLPKGKGRGLVAGTCTTCHSTHIIKQHRMSRPEWDDTITWMQRTQNLQQIPAAHRAKILDYLAAHFGPEDRVKQVTPWAQPLYQPNPLW